MEYIAQDKQVLIEKILATTKEKGIDLSYIAPELLPTIRPIDDFIEDPNNTNKHTSHDVEKIKASFNKFGIRQVINTTLKNGKLMISDGNGRLIAARELGYKFLPNNTNNDDNLTHTQYGMTANITARQTEFDWEMISKNVKALQAEGELNEVIFDDDFMEQVKIELEDIQLKNEFEPTSEDEQPSLSEFNEGNSRNPNKCPNCGYEID